MSASRLSRLAFAACTSVAIAITIAACASSPSPDRITVILAPDQKQFTANVSAFLERRCGTLDCHGQVGRPLRVYSGRGLRILNDASNVPGGALTTPQELQANYQSAIGLEPEVLSQVVADPGNNPPSRLLIVNKPRGSERHKGGTVVVAGDDGDRCITSWITGSVDTQACAAATAIP